MCSFGSSQSAPTTQFSTQTTTASPQAQAMYGQAWQQAQSAAARPFQPYSYDPSAFVAPINPMQMQAAGNIAGLQGAYQPFYQAAAGMTGAAGTTTTPQVVGQYMNPYLANVVDPTRAAIEQQQGMQRSQLTADQIRAGAFGQERGQLARAVLAGQQNLGLGQALAPLYQTGYGQAMQGAQADLQRQLQAGQLMGQLGTGYSQTGLGAAQALLGAGTLGQQTQQAGLQALYNQYLMQQQYPFQTAQFLASTAAGLGPGYGGTTSGYQQSAQPLSFFGNPLSDPDLKTGAREGDDEPQVIGYTKDGQKIYRYRLLNPDTGELGPPQIGLMADEVEERRPDAVGDYKGYRTVDYAKATDDAARLGGGVKGRGDYADGGSIEDILKAHGSMYSDLDKGLGSIVPQTTMPSAKLDAPSLTYQKEEPKKSTGLADLAKDALGLYGTGKSVLGAGKEIAGGLGLSSLLSGAGAGSVGALGGAPLAVMGGAGGLAVPTFGAAAPAAASGLAGLGSAIMSALPAALAFLSDPDLKTGVRPKFQDGGGLSSDELYDYLISKEADPREASLLTSAAGVESSYNPYAVHDKGTGYGLWGHRLDRYEAMKKATGEDRPGWQKQADFALGELRNRPEYKDVMSAKTPEELTRAQMFYERPLGFTEASPEKGMGYSERLASTRALMDRGVSPMAYTDAAPTEKPAGLSAIDRLVSRKPTEPASQGISGFLRGTAPEGVGEKSLDFLTSEKFLVPLLAGLGTMASSGSRYLAPAVLQGLGGGAKAYAELAQQQFEREKASEELGLRTRETALKEAALPLTERELKIKEQEAARKMRALQELAKSAGSVYSGTTDVTPEFPSSTTPAGEVPMPPARPTDLTTTPTAAPAPAEDFWSDVDPMMNPTKLLSSAQDLERKASVAAQDFPEWSKMLSDQALKFRSAAQEITKTGSVLKGGKMVPIPGSLETEKLKAQSEAETKADMELVDIQPKPGGSTYKVTRKQSREMAAPEVQPGAGTPPGGSVPQGAILSKQPAWVEKRIDDMRKDEMGMVDQFRERQIAKERLDALIDSLRVLQTGKFAERKAETIATLRSLGFDVPDTATANPAEFQKFVKNSTANVFDQVKSMGGKVLVSEIAGLTKANANPELQPEANAALLGQAKGLLDYEDKHFQDYSDWRKENPDAYDATDFERGWIKENPLSRYVKEAEMGIGARGAPLLSIEKRPVGYTYTNDHGVTGRWNGKSWDVVGGPKQ